MFEQVEREVAALGSERAGSEGLDNLRDSAAPAHEFGASITAMGSGAWIEAPPLTLDRGCVVAGRYQIEDSIGSGGSGRVFRAFDRATGTLIALKVLKPEMAREAKWLERLYREVRVARQIQHDHVVRIWDVGESDGLRFITMELATGGTLRRAVPTRSWSDKVRDARGALLGLVALHRAGIVHRDLKPENFLRMEDGRLVLSDFGLATHSAAVGTVMVGTPFYMAPELVMGEQSTTRTDVWAMGVVLHELFFGLRPEWEWRDYRRIIKSPLSAQASRVERRVFDVCRVATSDNPQERPADGEALAALLERALEGKRSRATTAAVLRAHPRRLGLFYAGTTLLGLSVLVLLTRGWWLRMPQADASSSHVAKGVLVVDPAGGPLRQLPLAREILDVPGELHCASVLPNRKTLFVVWGPDRVAEELDVTSGRRKPASLPPETWRVGCPEVSPETGAVLFEAEGDGSLGRIIKIIEKPGVGAHTLTAGSSPLWIPGREDFVFNIDEGHAAVYSLAQRNFVLAVGTDPTDGKLLIKKAVSPDGRFLATKHFAGPSGVTVLVRSLATLELVSQVAVGPRLNGLRFDETGDALRFATSQNGKSELVDVDWRTGQMLQRLESDGEGALEGDLSTLGGLVGIRDSSKHQIWSARGDALDRALVPDGTNFLPARDDEGNVFFVSLTRSESRVIRLWHAASGTVTTLTNGPFDMWPSPLPERRGWIYVQSDTNTVIRCPHMDDAEACAPLVKLPGQTFRPVLSPDLTKLAYLATFSSSLRASVYDLVKGQSVDLGPALNDEAPQWSGADRVWFVVGPGSNRDWTEYALPAGRATGRTQPMKAAPPQQAFSECGRFPFIAEASRNWACTRAQPRTLLSLLTPPPAH